MTWLTTTAREAGGVAIALGILGVGLSGAAGNLAGVALGGGAVGLGVLTIRHATTGATDADVRQAVEAVEGAEEQ